MAWASPAWSAPKGSASTFAAGTVSSDGKVVKEGDFISIDGATGEVLVGQIEAIQPRFGEETELVELLGWADQIRRLGVWANADAPEEAAIARELGAEGVGLCRTEHMFRQAERLPIFRRVILAAPEAARLKATATRLRASLDQVPADRRAQAGADLDNKKLTKIEEWFDRHGTKAVFLCRIAPGMREMISIPAGLSSMNFLKFIVFTFAGSLIWSISLTFVGYTFGHKITLMQIHIHLWLSSLQPLGYQKRFDL